MHPVDVTALLLRATLGVTMAAHGWNQASAGLPAAPVFGRRRQSLR
jgi:hypothetical protein